MKTSMFFYTARKSCDLRDLNGDVHRFTVAPGGIEDQRILRTTRPLAAHRLNETKNGWGNVKGGQLRELTPGEVASEGRRGEILSLPADEYEV